MSTRRHNLCKPADILASASQVTPWLWDGYLARGAITILTAGVKLGKSTLMSHLLNAMREGGTLAGAAVAKCRVAVASEEPKEAWNPRFRKFDLGGHVEVDLLPFPAPPPQADWEAYAMSYAEVPADLHIFDSLMHFLPPHAEGNLTILRNGLAPLRKLTALGRAVAVLHQPAKRTRGDFNFRGHGCIAADPDILMELKMPYGAAANDRRRILQVRSRLDLVPPRRMLQLDPEGNVLSVIAEPTADESFEAGWPALKIVLEDAMERIALESIVENWLSDYWKPSITTLRRWLEFAIEAKKIERFGKGRKNSPFRYALPGCKFGGLGDLPPIPDIEEMDRERYG